MNALIVHVKNKVCNNVWESLFFAFSWTYLRASFLADQQATKDCRRDLIKKLNWQYFFATPIVAVLIGVMAWLLADNDPKRINGFLKCVLVIAAAYSVFRVNEVFLAFVRDAKSHLEPVEHKSSLKYYERIPLAMRSYVELIILYGIIYFSLNMIFSSLLSGGKQCSICVWNAIYFSGITITTIGYGDITPGDIFTRFLAIYEVINGFSLIIVSFTVYVSRSIAACEYQINTDPTKEN